MSDLVGVALPSIGNTGGSDVSAGRARTRAERASGDRYRNRRANADPWAIGRGALMVLDALAAAVGVAVFGWAVDRIAVSGWLAALGALVGASALWVAIVASQGGYWSPGRQRFAVRGRILLRAAAWFLSLVLVASVVSQDRGLEVAALGMLPVAVLVGLGGGWLARTAHAARRRSGRGTRRVLAVGSPRVVAEYARKLEGDPLSHAELVGSMSVPPRESPADSVSGLSHGAVTDRVAFVPTPRQPERLDSDQAVDVEPAAVEVEPISDVAIAIMGKVEEVEADEVVVVGGTDLTGTDFRDLAWLLDERGRALSVLPVTWDVAPHRLRVDEVSGLSRVVLTSARRRPLSQIVKGVVDRTAAALALLLLLPLFAVLATAIRLDSPGSALFRQERVGRDGQVFTILKFRTMCQDAEQRKAQLAAQNQHGSGPLFKMKDDPRITRVGGFLRKTSLDELPQLFNVLMGQMSLVGPRPALPTEVAQYDPRAQRRLAVKPGLTGLWQVSGRSDLDWVSSVDLDLRYIERWSVGLDVSILVRTVGAVTQSRGAC